MGIHTRRRVHDTNLWLAWGAALYWASYAFRIMNPDPFYKASIGSGTPVLEDVFMLIWVVGSYCVCRKIGIRRSRTMLSGAMIAAAALVCICELLRLTLPTPLAIIVSCVDLFTLGASMILWGLAFASLEKQLAARNVMTAALISAGVVLAGQALCPWASFGLLMCACSAGASAIMLSGKVVLRSHRRTPQKSGRLVWAKLGAQRLAYGFCLGFFPAAAAALATDGMNDWFLAFTLGILLFSTLKALHSDEPPSTMLSALFLVACGSLCLPFMDAPITGMLPSLFTAIWLSWQALSSVQLSDLKESLGLSELAITLTDKVAIAVTILLGTSVCSGVEAAWGLSTQFVLIALPLAFAGLALFTMFTLAELVSVHQESDIRRRIARASAEHESQVFASIAAEYGLSARELEVFTMLAQGHTAAFIADVTGITPGTAKAHVAHIYQKLDVHSKDEMLELVEARGETE